MGVNPFLDDQTLSPSVEQYIDDVCARFESACRAGPVPRIEDFLEERGEPERTILLCELLLLDVHYRRKAGEIPTPAEYLARFPALDPDALAEALARSEKPARSHPDRPSGSKPSGASHLPATHAKRIRCPHCRNPIALIDTRSEEVLCPACASSFRVTEAHETRGVDQSKPLGKFQLLERVGVGAFGAVWRARDTELDRIVALKIPHTGLLATPTEMERFHREARAAAQLRHPGIVTVHDVALVHGLPVLVSDFVTGVNLRDFLQSRKLTFPEAAGLVAEVADALDHAHERGLVHRDIKPANIMLEQLSADSPDASPTDPAEDSASATGCLRRRPVVMDFGLALRQEAEVTMTTDGVTLGTPAYMSPEQAAGHGHAADRRSDVYSLGVVLYEMLVGELPFRGTQQMILHEVVHEEPKPPRRLNDRVPRDLETICLKALAKAPARRYPTARALAEDLRRYLRGEPILARPVSRSEKLWRWCVRNPWVAGLTAALILVFVAGFVGVTVQWLRAEEYWAQVLDREKKQHERLTGIRQSCEALYDHGVQSLERGDWGGAQLNFSSALAKLDSEKDPAVVAELEPQRQRLQNKLNEAKERKTEAEKKQQAELAVQDFRRLAGEVHFYAAGLDARGEQAPYYNPRQAEKVADEALAVANNWGRDLSDLPLPGERAVLKRELSDLLLLAAQAQLAPPTTRQAASTTLALLDRARLLGLPSRTEHRLRAQSYRVLGEKEKAAQETQAANRLTSTTALDHFLEGERHRTGIPDPKNPLTTNPQGRAQRTALLRAVEHYREALEADPGHFWARFQLGRCYLALARPTEAEAVFDACVALRKDSPWGHCASGLALALTQHHDQARRHLKRALELDPDFRPARLNLGLVHHLEKKYDAAAAEYQAALEPAAQGRLTLAAYYLGQLHLERGQFAEALKLFGEVLREQPDFVPAHLARAHAHFSLGEAERGLSALNGFLQVVQPGVTDAEAEACALRGRMLRRLAASWQFAKPAQRQAVLTTARAQLDSASQQLKGVATVWEDLGAVQELLGQPEKALQAYTESLRLQPTNVPVLLLRGWCQTQSLPKPDLQRARTDFAAVVGLEADNAEAHTGLGYIHATLNAPVDALREADLALLHGGSDYLVLHNVACIHAVLAQRNAAGTAGHRDVVIATLRRGLDLWKKSGRPAPSAIELIQGEPAFPPAWRTRPDFLGLVQEGG